MAKRGTLLDAANRLGLSPAAVSIQLKKLEADLNAKLFDHRPNKLVLTRQGQSFLREAGRVLEAVNRASAAVNNKEEQYKTKITIAMGIIGAKFFTPRIASFIERHPGLELTIITRESGLIFSQVIEGEVDLAIGQFENVPRGIHKVTLLKSGLLLALRPKHPLSRKAKLGLKDLSSHRLIMPASWMITRKLIDATFSRNNLTAQNVLEVNHCDTTTEFVRLGLGAGIVHDICVATEPKKNISFVDVSDLFGKMEMSLIYRKSALLSPTHRVFIDGLTRYAREKISTKNGIF